MPNTELLKKTLAYVEDHPDEWNQKTWATRTACGTAYCFAGHAVALARPDASPDFSVLSCDDDGETTGFIVIDGGPRPIDAVATELLELPIEQADELFAAHNTLDDLRRIVADLCDPARCPRCHGTGRYEDASETTFAYEACETCEGTGRVRTAVEQPGAVV